MNKHAGCYTKWEQLQLLWELIWSPHWRQCIVYTAIQTTGHNFQPKPEQEHELTVWFNTEGSLGAMAGPADGVLAAPRQ